MSHQHGSGEQQSSKGGLVNAHTAMLGFLAIAGTLLLFEHRMHVLGALPWLLILACPLLHKFMHRGHRSHGHEEHGRGENR